MESPSSPPIARFEVNDRAYELSGAEFSALLFEIVETLVFEKLVDRVSYVLQTGEDELTGSGSSHFDPLCVSLYRHLKEERCHGPQYPQLGGTTQSFRIHSIKNGLVAVAFFLKAGVTVPHFAAGTATDDVLVVLDRGARSHLSIDDPDLLSKVAQLFPA
jgi:hypothetical protein